MNAKGIKCGNHNGSAVYHPSVTEVYACYQGTKTVSVVSHTPPAGVEHGARSAVLDRLSRQAGHPGVTTREAREVDTRLEKATGPQVRFLRSLLASKDIPPHEFEWSIRIEAALGNEDIQTGGREAITECTLGKREASGAITKLKGFRERTRYTESRQSKANTAATTVVTQDGIYRNPSNGEIYKVQWNRASGDGRALYAKRLMVSDADTLEVEKILEIPAQRARAMDMDWVFVRGLIKNIRPEWRMSLAEAEKFGALYGRCLRCKRTLTAEESIARAMGPVCAGKGNWA